MTARFRLLAAVVVLISIVAMGCGPLSHRAPFVITAPHNDASFPSNPDIVVRIDVIDLTHLNLGDGNTYTWDHYEYQVSDNGDLVTAHDAPLSVRSVNVGLTAPVADGVHWVDVDGRAARAVVRSLEDEPGWEFSPWYHQAVCFWVGPNRPADVCSTRTIVQPVRPSTPTPSPVPPTPTPVPVILEIDAYPNPVYYGSTCPAISSVTLRAALSVPEGIAAGSLDVTAHVGVLVGTNSNNIGALVVPLEPTQTWDVSTGGQLFEGILDLSHSYNDAANHFEPAALGEAHGALLWYADAAVIDPSLQTVELLDQSPNEVIDLAPCPTSGQGNQPRSGGNAPRGSETGCGQYTNQLSCNLAGCSWIPQSSSCVISP